MMWHHPIVRAVLNTTLHEPYVPTIPNCLLFLENAIYFLALHSFLCAVFFDKNVCLLLNNIPMSSHPPPFPHWSVHCSIKAPLYGSKISSSVKPCCFIFSEWVAASSPAPWLRLHMKVLFCLMWWLLVTCDTPWSRTVWFVSIPSSMAL